MNKADYLNITDKHGTRIAFEIYRQGKICGLTSYRLLGRRQRQFALLLGSLGVRAGGRVLLVAENRPEWATAWFGIALAGAVCVAADPDSPPAVLKHICARAGLSAICVSRRYASKFINAEKRAPVEPLIDSAIDRSIDRLIDRLIDPSIDRSTDLLSDLLIDPAIPVVIIDSIAPTEQAFVSVSLNGIARELPLKEPENTAGFPLAGMDDTAALFYARDEGGTVCETTVSHGELIERAFSGGVKIYPRDRLLSTISLANSFELSRGLLRAVAAGALTIYPDYPGGELSPQQLIAEAGALNPTIILARPSLVIDFREKFIDPILRADPFYRHALTKTLAYRRAGRKLLSALGKIIRCLEIDGSLPDEIKKFLDRIKFPYSAITEFSL